jgi:hypothetical protein
VKIGATKAVARATAAMSVFMFRLLVPRIIVRRIEQQRQSRGGQRLLTVTCHAPRRVNVMEITFRKSKPDRTSLSRHFTGR